MKILLIMLALTSTMVTGVLHAQTVTDSWAIGFGPCFPRFSSVNITSLNSDYGASLSIRRNFSEHVGLRWKGGYSHLEGEWSDTSVNLIKEMTDLITSDFDLLYYILPCVPVSPYLFAGVGGNYKNITMGQAGYPDKNDFGYQFNLGGGAEFKMNSAWSIATEFGYHITDNSELEGIIIPAELNGHDSYIVLSASINFFFGQGAPCQKMTQKMNDLTDYNRIENLIVKHIPKEVTKEVVVDRYIRAISNDRLVLVGVNFAFDKSDLLPVSYPVLDKTANLLNMKPDVKVEIKGYTDYIGTDAYNQELSVDRAETVKAYLVYKRVAASRLTTVGYGENNPVEDNSTEEGRAMNRRIVFRIIR
ncbi:OmpA family protein [candidate division KSB1 bacterium]|nr:OmpA family protein [candidate division KSB1 bacterium]